MDAVLTKQSFVAIPTLHSEIVKLSSRLIRARLAAIFLGLLCLLFLFQIGAMNRQMAKSSAEMTNADTALRQARDRLEQDRQVLVLCRQSFQGEASWTTKSGN